MRLLAKKNVNYLKYLIFLARTCIADALFVATGIFLPDETDKETAVKIPIEELDMRQRSLLGLLLASDIRVNSAVFTKDFVRINLLGNHSAEKFASYFDNAKRRLFI